MDNYWHILEPIWRDQETSEEPEVFLKWFDNLTEVQKVLFPTHWLVAEVHNGGFNQYFWNSTGLHAPEAVIGFQKLGLIDITDIVRNAVSMLGDRYPRERNVRQYILSKLEHANGDRDPFDVLDNKFYELFKIPGAPDHHDDNRFSVAASKYVGTILN